MKREIKFRVWTGEVIEYNVIVGKFGAFYVNPGAKGNGIDENDSASLTQFNTIYPKEVPVMQFTGLLDKNGKEIYEGDVVKVDEEYKKMFEVSGLNEIKFYCGCFMIGDSIKPLTYFVRAEDITKSFMEVIGNIWENPELIK